MRGRRLLLASLAAFPVLAPAAPRPSIVLISVDTLRADRLGCYGYRRIRTPHIDALAQSGTLFAAVSSPVPMTLPAHASLLSSTYPFAHGVEENGQRVPPDTVTLPSALKAAGYRTAAFIGGYVLDARFGLTPGFDLYDSPFHLSPQPGEEPPELKRPAADVLGAAARWIAAQSGHPFFAFIHLYDVHQPYTHGGYDAEVAYVDEALGRFQQSLSGGTLIAFTSDHGESLGEHGEDTHGYFIYQSTLHVPLILRWPAGAGPSKPRVDAPLSLIDVAPTLLEFAGARAPGEFRGRSLMPLVREHPPHPDEPVYSESMYARDHVDASPLRAIRVGRYKLIEAPRPELYDLAADPRESKNLYDQNRPVALDLRARLLSLYNQPRPPPKPVSPDVLSRLRSLGYLAGGAPRNGTGSDPKDRLDEYRTYSRAIRYANSERLPEAIREFKKVLEQDGKNAQANFYLAVCYYRLHRLEEATAALNATLAAARDYPPAEELLGTIWLLKKDYVLARQQFMHLASVAPNDFGAHYNLGILSLREGKLDDAQRELETAARLEPGSAQAHSALGSLYDSRGNPQRAAEEFEKALAIDPGDRAARKMLEQLRARSRP